MKLGFAFVSPVIDWQPGQIEPDMMYQGGSPLISMEVVLTGVYTEKVLPHF